MKRSHTQRLIITIILTCLFYLQSTAQKNQYIDVWGGAGYSFLHHGIDNTKVPGGIGYLLGAGYEYDVNQMMFIIGAEFSGLNSKTVLNGYTQDHDFPYPYIANYNITYHYSLINYQEKHGVGYLNIPLQVGMKFNRYYALVGAKVGLNLFGSSQTTSLLQTTATDPMLIDTLGNMPNHYLNNKKFDQKGKMSVGLNIAPSLEFGVVLDEWLNKPTTKKTKEAPKSQVSYRAGVFVDYGVININSAATTNKVLTDPVSNPVDVKVNGLLSSTLAANKSLESMLVGVKFTMLFELPNSPKRPKQPVPVLNARVVDAKTNANLQANMSLSTTTSDHKQLFRKTTDKNGMISQQLKAGKYQVNVLSTGYVNYKSVIKHINSDTILIAMQQKIVPQPIPVFYAHVVNADTKANLVADISVSSIPGKNQIAKRKTDKTGMTSQQIKPGKYLVNASAEGYVNYEDTVIHSKKDTLLIALKPKPVLYAHVIDADTKTNLQAEVTVSSTPDNKLILKKVADKTGMVSQVLLNGKYQVNATFKGYLYYNDTINISKTDTLLIALQPIKKETKVILKNLFFEVAMADILPASEPTLEELYQFLLNNTKVNIQIVGHTDNSGNANYNQRLSQNRAKAVQDALIKKGIDASRLSWLGKGANEPIATNVTEEGRAKNRRVEIVIK